MAVLTSAMSVSAALQDVRSLGVFFAPFYSILRVLHFGCSAQNKDSTLHQTESLHMLSTYVKRKQVVSFLPSLPDTVLDVWMQPLLEKQWRAVLLLTLTGCGVAPPDLLCYPEASLAHSNSQTESATAGLMQHLLTQHQMCGLPESSRVREKVCLCPEKMLITLLNLISAVNRVLAGVVWCYGEPAH